MVVFWLFDKRKGEPCRVINLSSVLPDFAEVALLKIDVEKAEEDVLDGIDDDDWLKIKQLAVECHCGEAQVDRLKNLLCLKGYEVERLDSTVFPQLDNPLLKCRRKRED